MARTPVRESGLLAKNAGSCTAPDVTNGRRDALADWQRGFWLLSGGYTNAKMVTLQLSEVAGKAGRWLKTGSRRTGGLPPRNLFYSLQFTWRSRLVDSQVDRARPELAYSSEAVNYLWRNRNKLSPQQQLQLVEWQQDWIACLKKRRALERKLGFGDPKTPEQIEASQQMGQLFQEWDAHRRIVLDEAIQMMGDDVDGFVQWLNIQSVRGMLRRMVREMGGKRERSIQTRSPVFAAVGNVFGTQRRTTRQAGVPVGACPTQSSNSWSRPGRGYPTDRRRWGRWLAGILFSAGALTIGSISSC